MITGAHTILYSSDPEAVRAFFRDVLEFDSVDAGHGWLIFALPPGEVAMHPIMGEGDQAKHELYLMCDDVDETVATLTAKGVECSEIQDLAFGRMTAITLPDGTDLGLYEPQHPTALALEG